MISHAAGQVTERCDFVIRPGSELLLCRARDLEDPRGKGKPEQTESAESVVHSRHSTNWDKRVRVV